MFADLLTKLLRRDDLSTDEAARAMDAVMRGEAHPAHVAGLLVGLAMKGERPGELVGLARTMRAHGVQITAGPVAVDTCGTGGDRAGTFNISTAAAIVVAATGVQVVKHGNRSVSSHCGSADVLEALGVAVDAPPAVVQHALDDAGMCFCFAPTFHPAMRHAGEARRALGVPSAFNLLGPLTNPARVPFQVVGVARPELTELMARALQQLGARRAWVVHGADGLDELSTTGYTKVSECHGDVVRTFYVHPADVGLQKAAAGALAGGDAAHNAAVVTGVLAGHQGPARDVVLLNAGAALLVAGRVPSLRDGIATASRAIDDGAAARTLARLVAATRPPA
ncbi:MAG: anthranilate phosphoribosyltransferase [Vicinamibacterales bacterium]